MIIVMYIIFSVCVVIFLGLIPRARITSQDEEQHLKQFFFLVMVIVFGKQEKVEKGSRDGQSRPCARQLGGHEAAGGRTSSGGDSVSGSRTLMEGPRLVPGGAMLLGTLAVSLSGHTLGDLGLLPTMRPLLPAHPPNRLSLSATGRVFLSTLGPQSVPSVWAIK